MNDKIAEGLVDIYPRLAPTSEWDTAAAHAILEGAGGQVVELNGKEVVYGKENTNPYFIASGIENKVILEELYPWSLTMILFLTLYLLKYFLKHGQMTRVYSVKEFKFGSDSIKVFKKLIYNK